jgi:hypothetical protein
MMKHNPVFTVHAAGSGRGWAYVSVSELQLIAQDVVAMDGVNGGLVLPTLAEQFPRDGGMMFGNRAGKFLGEIKIPPDTLFVGTSEAKHGFGATEIDDILELTIGGEAFGIVVPKLHDQRLQLLKFVRKAGGGFHPLAFLITVFRSETYSLSIHNGNLPD